MSQEGQAEYVYAGWKHRRGEFEFGGMKHAFIEGFGRNADKLLVCLPNDRLIVCPERYDSLGYQYRPYRGDTWMTQFQIAEQFHPSMDRTGLAYANRPVLPPAQ